MWSNPLAPIFLCEEPSRTLLSLLGSDLFTKSFEIKTGDSWTKQQHGGWLRHAGRRGGETECRGRELPESPE